MAQQEFHTVGLTDRSALTVTGVSEVLSFEENAVQLNTARGCLWVHGEGLRLKHLDPDGGCLSLTGEVTALVYDESRPKGGWLSRLLG